MRFLLDEDVDAAVIGLLVKNGHDAWSVPQAALSASSDEDVAVYAQDKRAVVVTHDAEFSSWRRRRCVGRHLYLHCSDTDALAVLELRLAPVVGVLKGYQDIYCEITINGFEVVTSWE